MVISIAASLIVDIYNFAKYIIAKPDKKVNRKGIFVIRDMVIIITHRPG